MDRLKVEHDRLIADDTAEVQKEFDKYIEVYRKRYGRHRTVEYNIDMIAQHENKYKSKYKDVYPELSKKQRDILDALNISITR